MGMDSFAPDGPNVQCFRVKNIDPQERTLFIFNYPINYGCTRDLLAIPGVSEGDIRSALLKGQIGHKIKYGEITVLCSDIDLLQFNTTQLAFLQAAGIVNGLQIGPGQLTAIEQLDIQLVGVVDGVNTMFTIPTGTWIQEAPYKIIVYRNGVKQRMADDYFISESGGPGTGFTTITFTVPPSPTPLPVDIMTADYFQSNA